MSTADCEPRGAYQVGFGRAIVTPQRGIPLSGYFAPRFNRGVRDHLHVRACLFRQGATTAGIVQMDVLEVTAELISSIRAGLRDAGADYADELIVCATHTHTGPDLCRHLNDTDPAAFAAMSANLVRQSMHAVQWAERNLAPAELFGATVVNNPFAFNRRYWMKDGALITNPGKLNPDIDRPEGPVDREIGVLKIVQDGETAGFLTNIVNHTDTIGDDLVSADWPGFLERALQRRCDRQAPVITLVGASGNINHFDVTSEQSQTWHGEARRIGEGYADIVWQALPQAEKVAGPLEVKVVTFPLRKRPISPEELAGARQLLADTEGLDGVTTSEDLAKGSPVALRYFAKELLQYAENEGGTVAEFPLTCIRFGRDLAIVSLPGEPFTEIGLALKRQSPFGKTFVVSNANGYAGYLPLQECFARGGYEPLPVRFGGAEKGMAESLIEHGVQALS